MSSDIVLIPVAPIRCHHLSHVELTEHRLFEQTPDILGFGHAVQRGHCDNSLFQSLGNGDI